MDDRRPAPAGAQNPAYRPAHPPHLAPACGVVSRTDQAGHIPGTCGCARPKALSSASRARPVASGTRCLYRSTVVVMDLWLSQRETSEIGTPSASAVLANG